MSCHHQVSEGIVIHIISDADPLARKGWKLKVTFYRESGRLHNSIL